MSKKIILISGKATSGKTTTYNYIHSKMLSKIQKVSFAEPLKKMAKEFFDWNGEKDDYGRKLLIFLGGYIGNEIFLKKDYNDKYVWNESLFNQPVEYSGGVESGVTYWNFISKKIDNLISKDKLFWANIAVNKIHNSNKKIFVSDDFRYVKEVLAIKLNFESVIVLRIQRNVPLIDSKSEMDLDNYKFDYVIDNNGTLPELYDNVDKFLLEVL